MYLLSYLKETILDNDPSCNDKIMILKEKRNTRFTVFNPRWKDETSREYREITEYIHL